MSEPNSHECYPRAELSEIRKNWHNNQPSSYEIAAGGERRLFAPDDSLSSKLDNLCAAYNDIQDRLYDIDKSWKNNVVLYGVPAAEGSSSVEEDPAITEEKVSACMFTGEGDTV